MDKNERKTETYLSLTGDSEGTTHKKVGRPACKGSVPVTWSIRGVERDTRAMIEKAAKRSAKTLGQYMNDEIRSFVKSQLTGASQLAASQKDNQINKCGVFLKTWKIPPLPFHSICTLRIHCQQCLKASLQIGCHWVPS